MSQSPDDKQHQSHPSGESACDGKKGYFTAYHVGHQWVCIDENCSWRRSQNTQGENGAGSLAPEARPAGHDERSTDRETVVTDRRDDQLLAPSATLTIDPEVLALAKSLKGKSTRQPVYVTDQLAREIIRPSDGGAERK